MIYHVYAVMQNCETKVYHEYTYVYPYLVKLCNKLDI